MNTFIFFISVQNWISQQLNDEFRAIQNRWWEIILKIAEWEKSFFEFFWISIVPSVVILQNNITVETFAPYKWFEQIKDFI